MAALQRFNDVYRDLTRAAMAARKGRGDLDGYRALKEAVSGVPRSSAVLRERFLREAPGAAATGSPEAGDQVLPGVDDAEVRALAEASERVRSDLRLLAGLARLPVTSSEDAVIRAEDALAEGAEISDIPVEAPATAEEDPDGILRALEGTSLGDLAKELARDMGGAAAGDGEPDLAKMMSLTMSKMAQKIGSGELDHTKMFGEAMSLMSGPLAGKAGVPDLGALAGMLGGGAGGAAPDLGALAGMLGGGGGAAPDLGALAGMLGGGGGMPDLGALAGMLGGAGGSKKTSSKSTRRNGRRKQRDARNAALSKDAPGAGEPAE